MCASPVGMSNFSIEKLGIPTFKSDFQRWKAWLSSKSVSEWEEFIANSIHAFTAPDSSKEPWILIKLSKRKEIAEEDSIVEETDHLQINTGTKEVKML